MYSESGKILAGDSKVKKYIPLVLVLLIFTLSACGKEQPPPAPEAITPETATPDPSTGPPSTAAPAATPIITAEPSETTAETTPTPPETAPAGAATVEPPETTAPTAAPSAPTVTPPPAPIPANPPQTQPPPKQPPDKPVLPGTESLKRRLTEEQYAEAYAAASEIVHRHKNKNEIEMLRGIWKDVREVYYSGVHSETGSYFNTVYGALILKEASCAGVTRAVGLCLFILDYPYEHVNEGAWEHQWVRVFLQPENEWLIIDSQGGIFAFESGRPTFYPHGAYEYALQYALSLGFTHDPDFTDNYYWYSEESWEEYGGYISYHVPMYTAWEKERIEQEIRSFFDYHIRDKQDVFDRHGREVFNFDMKLIQTGNGFVPYKLVILWIC
jgi:hypothetical protein